MVTCVCPGDGCQAGACALRPRNAHRTQNAMADGFIRMRSRRRPLTYVSNDLAYRPPFSAAGYHPYHRALLAAYRVA